LYCERRVFNGYDEAAKECAKVQREALPYGRVKFIDGSSSLGSLGRKLATVGIFADKR
jgi:hypothetical protein